MPSRAVFGIFGALGLALATSCSGGDSGASAGSGGTATAGSGAASNAGSGALTTGGTAGRASTDGGGRASTDGGGRASTDGGGANRGGTSASGSAGVPGTAGGTAGAANVGGASSGGATALGGATSGGRNAGGRASGGRGGAGASSGGSAGTSGMGGGAGSGDIVVPDGYELVWHDEFDKDGKPDPKNYNYEHGFVRNEEDQWYQEDNATVAGGLLVIEGRKERVENPNYTGSGDWKTSRQYAEYTSSSLTTSGLQSFQYGRFEMRARIPTSSGMWPAWWTLGVSGEWPSNGEIDIMEYYAGKVLANVACGTSTRWQAKWDSQTKSLTSLGANWSDAFHVWRMDWDDQNIGLYLDDQVMNTTALSSMLNPDGKSPFQQKAYMIMNLALGGMNGGSLTGTSFPVKYEIDYLRVFQKM